MEINLINKEEYERLSLIQRECKVLTFQNKGYEGIQETLNEEEKGKVKEIETLLSKSIKGFCEFQNFKLDMSGDPRVRFQYSYSDNFTGVGYIYIIELYKGFI